MQNNIPEIYINLHYNPETNELEIMKFSEEYIIFPNQDRCFFLPDMISNDDLVIQWLKDINLSKEKFDKIIDSLIKLGAKVAHLMNKI